MGLLPKNEPKVKDITPKMFFIWGQSMSGKTFLARQFPNPVIINTDGNAKKVETPSIDVTDFKTFIAVMSEIESGKHTFETVIIDLVDDIKTMLENYVLEKYGIEALADAPYGKAFSDVKNTWKALMVRLSQMPYNVIFISHVIEVSDDANSSRTVEVPSLEQKYYNMTMGRCDLSIKCRKLGSTYHQSVVNKRDTYFKADIKNKDVLAILTGVTGVFEDDKASASTLSRKAPETTPKQATATKKVVKSLPKAGTATKITPEKVETVGIDPAKPGEDVSVETPLQKKALKQLKPLSK